jgi:biopolymer transport protein TolR
MGAKLGASGPIADINVTPLIDVVLVLLVVFMVITPMLQSGMPVDLPTATQTTTVNDAGQFIVISVQKGEKEGDPAKIWVEDKKVSVDDTSLVDAVNEEFRDNPTTLDENGVEVARAILVKGDRRLDYESVRKVMDLLADKGMTTILVAAGKEQ